MHHSIESLSDKSIIIFDGYCNLCNGFINFCIDHDPEEKYLFSPLDSATSQELMPAEMIEKYKKNPLEGTFFLWDKGSIYSRSEAAFQIIRHLDTWLKFLAIFQILPKFITDSTYKWIAKNRYKMFGRTESCRMPTSELKSRFLD